MNDISRKKAAEVAADFFGRRKSGASCACVDTRSSLTVGTGRFEETAARNGYCTWSAWDGEGREWKYQRDVSIRANRDSEQTYKEFGFDEEILGDAYDYSQLEPVKRT